MLPITTIDRRQFLRGAAGVAVILPRLALFADASSNDAARNPRRFCAMYTANGMCLPDPANGIDEWSWFPKQIPNVGIFIENPF